ncbi:uncharacterized protein EV420DRAFT_102491 [Desarmillaria tabescens]|uniref:Uncharacterized protein n=1 Tax=Armillaria tabescens TaxID=1929756 RepID=A0AA39NRP3_ARMTA|nr:uncharacterized protein EV420DRAFT_102491 [Desarmillaria tabescens]KAK0470273.1 hypothetical protein EV420DRAFT_102491 [Desarmillaria tabescens]
MADEFFIGVEPFLFKICGGPVPQYYENTNKRLQDLANVYAGGPRADPHIHAAWRLYYHVVKLRDMLDDEDFRTRMRLLHSAPYEMLDVRGSVLRWRKLKEDAKRWNNADGPGSLKRIGDEARRQEQEEGDLYASDEDVQLQRKEDAYVSGDEDDNVGDVDMGGRKTARAAPRRAIPLDPLDSTKGSDDKGLSRATRSRGKRPRTEAPEIDKAHPKKKPYLNGRLTSQDVKRLPPLEREKYLMSLPGLSKSRTRCERCEEFNLTCFFPAVTSANPNPACIQCRSRCRGCSARKAGSSSAAPSSSTSSQAQSRADTPESEVELEEGQTASSSGVKDAF